MTSDNINARNEIQLRLKPADLTIMIDALRLASSTSLMYGREADGARDRLRELSDILLEMVPIPRGSRSSAYAWFDAFQDLKGAAYYTVFAREKEAYVRGGEANLFVQVDRKIYTVAERCSVAEAERCLPKLLDFVEEVSPVSCVRLETIDVQMTPEDIEGVENLPFFATVEMKSRSWFEHGDLYNVTLSVDPSSVDAAREFFNRPERAAESGMQP